MTEMKAKLLFWGHLIWVLPMVFFAGCAATKPDIQPARIEPARTVEITTPGNAFYYFTEAQMHRKRGDFSKAVDFLKQAIKLDPDSMMLTRELVQLLWKQKNNKAANTLIDDLISKKPENLENLILYAKIKHSLNYVDEAKSAYEKVIAIDPKQKDVYLLLGGLYTDEGSNEFALQVYTKLVQQFPGFFGGYYLLGQVNVQMDRPEEAEKSFLKALEIEPGLNDARYELISLLRSKRRKGYEKEVIRLYQQMLNENPQDTRATIELGYFYHETGKSKEAEKIFTALGLKSKSDKQVLQYIIRLYIDQLRFDTAITILNKMLEGAPESTGIHYILGLAYDGNGDSKRSIHHLKKVNPGSAFFPNAAVHISFLYQQDGKIEEAIQYLKKVVEIEPDKSEYLLYLGGLYEEKGAFSDAENVLKKGIEIDPENSQLYFRLGIVYDKWGKKEESIQLMRKVIQMDPKNANALNYLGYTFAELGENLDEAEMLIREALKYKPDDGYIIDSLGWVYYKKGVYEKALEFLQKATLLVPDDSTILEHLGDAYLKTNDKKKALEVYQKSLMNVKNGKEDIDRKIRELIDEGY